MLQKNFVDEEEKCISMEPSDAIFFMLEEIFIEKDRRKEFSLHLLTWWRDYAIFFFVEWKHRDVDEKQR